jgi:hypothetical protein
LDLLYFAQNYPKRGNIDYIISARRATGSEKARYMAKVMMNSLPEQLTLEEIAELEVDKKRGCKIITSY